MYIKKRDIEVISALLGLLTNAIEGGAVDVAYWQPLSADAHELFDKMIKQRGRYDDRNEVKKALSSLKKRGIY